MPKFSIIIPVYNVAPYLRECLDSVLAQTFADWEAICVDDGSTDESGAILDEYAARDSRFRVFHKENGGVSSARNLALDNVRGEWVWFVDADDVVWSKSLKSFAATLSDGRDVDSLSFECIDFDSQSEVAADSITRKTDVYEGCSLPIYQRFNRGGTVTLYKNEVIGTQRFKQYRLSEDTLFSVQYFFKCKAYKDSNLKAYFRRIRIGSATRRPPDALYMKDWFGAQKEILNCIRMNKETFSSIEWNCIVKDFSNSFYYTNQLRYFRLSSRERKELFPLWFSNLKELNSLGKVPLYQRFVLGVLTLFKFPWLTKILVLLPYKVLLRIKKSR